MSNPSELLETLVRLGCHNVMRKHERDGLRNP